MMTSSGPTSEAMALAAAYNEHGRAILRYCSSKLKSTQEAEDMTQETFLRAWEYLRSGKTIEDFRTFLFRIAENLIIDNSRKKKSVSLDDLCEQGFDICYEPTITATQLMDAEIALLSAERKHEYRLLVMRYVEGLRPVDIAQQTGLAPNTVVVRLSRALQKITKKFRLQPTRGALVGPMGTRKPLL